MFKGIAFALLVSLMAACSQQAPTQVIAFVDAPTASQMDLALSVAWDQILEMPREARPAIQWRSCPCEVAVVEDPIDAPIVAWAVFLPLPDDAGHVGTKWTDAPTVATTGFVRAVYDYKTYLMTGELPARTGAETNETKLELAIRQTLRNVGL